MTTSEIKPKPMNMDGDSFLGWLMQVDAAITSMARSAYLDRSPKMIARFNCNYDPTCAAREWLRDELGKAP